MKIRKRYLIAGIAGLAFVVVIGSGLFAAGGRFCDWGSPMGHRFGGFHKDMLPGDFAEHVLGRIDGRVADLQLTEPQKARYQEIRTRLKERIETQVIEQKALKEQIRAELRASQPNPQVVSDLVKRRIRAFSASLEEGPDLFTEFYTVLDENQKAKVLAHVRERVDKGPGWR